MKKISTVVAKKVEKVESQKLTIGLDLGDRSSWYCVLNEGGDVVLEQKLATTPKAMSKQQRSWILGKQRRVAGAALALAIVLVPAVVATGSAQAQTLSVLYSFKGVPDGRFQHSVELFGLRLGFLTAEKAVRAQ